MPTLRRLREHGFRIALDDVDLELDFLGAIEHLPLDMMKFSMKSLERCSPILRMEIVRALVRLAQHADIHLVAKCVETKEQLEELREAGLHIAQGYWFGEPLSA